MIVNAETPGRLRILIVDVTRNSHDFEHDVSRTIAQRLRDLGVGVTKNSPKFISDEDGFNETLANAGTDFNCLLLVAHGGPDPVNGDVSIVEGPSGRLDWHSIVELTENLQDKIVALCVCHGYCEDSQSIPSIESVHPNDIRRALESTNQLAEKRCVCIHLHPEKVARSSVVAKIIREPRFHASDQKNAAEPGHGQLRKGVTKFRRTKSKLDHAKKTHDVRLRRMNPLHQQAPIRPIPKSGLDRAVICRNKRGKADREWFWRDAGFTEMGDRGAEVEIYGIRKAKNPDAASGEFKGASAPPTPGESLFLVARLDLRCSEKLVDEFGPVLVETFAIQLRRLRNLGKLPKLQKFFPAKRLHHIGFRRI
jgi:hypothetical protein